MAYKKGQLTIEEDYYDNIGELAIMLPHSCDQWVIGNKEDAEQLIDDLKQAIVKLERGEES